MGDRAHRRPDRILRDRAEPGSGVEVVSSLDLVPALREAGVATAFDGGQADFSAISDTPLVADPRG